MEWLYEMCGMKNTLDFEIPMERIREDLGTESQQRKLSRVCENIEKILCRQIYKDNTIGQELYILEVSLYKPVDARPVAEVLDQVIPGNTMIVFVSGGKCLLFYNNEVLEDWYYEEELRYDDDLELERSLNIESDRDAGIEAAQNMVKVFCSPGLNYVCLRRVIDYVKIREEERETAIAEMLVACLMVKDEIEFISDIPFVRMSKVSDAYMRALELKGERNMFQSLEDYRYGIDQEFRLLNEDDFTTPQEVDELVEKAERYIIPKYGDALYGDVLWF